MHGLPVVGLRSAWGMVGGFVESGLWGTAVVKGWEAVKAVKNCAASARMEHSESRHAA